MLLTAPTYFNLKETNKGTVLVNRGVLVKEDVSEKYGNRQFYFMDQEDKKLKCLSGGSLNYIVDLFNLQANKTEVKITYDGTKELENGKYKGKEAHQFIVEAEGMESEPEISTPTAESTPQDADALE